jgi:hypothetical protein
MNLPEPIGCLPAWDLWLESVKKEYPLIKQRSWVSSAPAYYEPKSPSIAQSRTVHGDSRLAGEAGLPSRRIRFSVQP